MLTEEIYLCDKCGGKGQTMKAQTASHGVLTATQPGVIMNSNGGAVTYSHPIYPVLFKGTATEFIDKPCTLDNGEKLWQQCYICGTCIQFAKDIGRWQHIGGGLIRHKDCEPPPYRGGIR